MQLKFVLALVLALAIAAQATWTPSRAVVMEKLHAKINDQISQNYEARVAAAKEYAARATVEECAAAARQSPCSCSRDGTTETGCVWTIGLRVITPGQTTTAVGLSTGGLSDGGFTQQSQVSISGICVPGTEANGPTSSFYAIFDNCWWPMTGLGGHACAEQCVWREGFEIGFVYFRAELKFPPTFALSQAQLENGGADALFGQLSFNAFILYGTPTIAGLDLPVFSGSVLMRAAPGTGGLGGTSGSTSTSTTTTTTAGTTTTTTTTSSATTSASSAASEEEGFPGIRGAAFFLLIDSYIVVDSNTIGAGAAFEGTTGCVPITGTGCDSADAFRKVVFSSLSKGTVLSADTPAKTIKRWTFNANIEGGGTLEYVCVFGELGFTWEGNTLTPYESKCDLNLDVTLASGQVPAVRVIVASATAVADLTTSSTDVLQFGPAGSVLFATSATNGLASATPFPVINSAVSDCGSLNSPWITNEDFVATLNENNGAETIFGCFYAKFETTETGASVKVAWDPKNQIDEEKAEQAIAAKSAASGLVASPIAVLAAAAAALLALFVM